MRFLVLLALCALSAAGAARAATDRDARWEQHAQNVRIVRDNWGIAHIYGKSDADTVFGAIYAQAEDDFARIERNYLIGLGELAQAEGEGADLQRPACQRLFVDHVQLKHQYSRSPAWLKTADAGMVGWPELLLVEAPGGHAEGHPAFRALDGVILHRRQHRRRHRRASTSASCASSMAEQPPPASTAWRTPGADEAGRPAAPTALPLRPAAAHRATPCSGSIRIPRIISARSCTWSASRD